MRAGCEGLIPDRSGATRCARAISSSAIVAALCSRAQVDGGVSACISLIRVTEDSLVLETTDAVYLVVDGAKSM